MKFKQPLQILLLIIASLFLLIACSSTDEPATVNTISDGHDDSDAHHDDDDDHHDENNMDGHVHAEVPVEYKGITNPLPVVDEDTLQAGQAIFQTNCVACHGEEGQGDGVAATALDPKPANLADGMMMSMVDDDYLFWRVRKGGATEPFNSAMPSWEYTLSEEETWQVVTYIRTLADGNNERQDDHDDSDDH